MADFVPGPQEGLDGMYHCQTCGTLMTEQRFYCERCGLQINAGTRRILIRVLLCLLVAALVALGSYCLWVL